MSVQYFKFQCKSPMSTMLGYICFSSISCSIFAKYLTFKNIDFIYLVFCACYNALYMQHTHAFSSEDSMQRDTHIEYLPIDFWAS